MGTMPRFKPAGPWAAPETEPLETSLFEGEADALTGQNWAHAWHVPAPGQIVVVPDRRPGPAGEAIHPYADGDAEITSGRAHQRWNRATSRWQTTRKVVVAHCGEI